MKDSGNRRAVMISPASYAWMLAMATLAMALTGAFTLRAQGPETKISPAPAGPAQVIEMRIGDEIEPVMAEYVVGGIEEAARIHASLILITMDTPGGLSTSMEDIIHHILDSPVPVAIFISPAGSRGASAGFFILLSADIAAMAPGTHTGAASPLLAIGGVPLQVDETLKKKILNDATAFLRSYSAKRGTKCGAGGIGRRRRQGLDRNGSARRQTHRSDRKFAGRLVGKIGWPHDQAI